MPRVKREAGGFTGALTVRVLSTFGISGFKGGVFDAMAGATECKLVGFEVAAVTTGFTSREFDADTVATTAGVLGLVSTAKDEALGPPAVSNSSVVTSIFLVAWGTESEEELPNHPPSGTQH